MAHVEEARRVSRNASPDGQQERTIKLGELPNRDQADDDVESLPFHAAPPVSWPRIFPSL